MITDSFSAYQEQAISSAIYPNRGTLSGILYCTLKLNGEAGEIAEKVGKILRDNNGVITDEKRVDLQKELGDVLWYIAALADELHLSLTYIANENIAKLKDRKERGVLGGSGDNR